MADIATIQTRIDAIDELLAGGVQNVRSDTDSVTYDLEALREERKRLSKIIASQNTSQFRRVVFKNA